MKKLFAGLFFVISLLIPMQSLFAEDNHEPKPYDTKELPQAIKDFRRFEIITLGSLPFVMIDTTLVYSGIRYAQHDFASEYKPNIFDKSSLTTDEQMKILFTSMGISVGIGFSDFIVNVIKRETKKNKAKKQKQNNINIVPISQDPDAIRLEVKGEHN